MAEKVTRRPHGGDVWNFSRKYGFPIEKIIDFSAPINPLGPSPEAVKAIKKLSSLIRFYTDQNPVELKRDICEYIGGIKPDNVILGNGSVELIYMFVDVFARGSEVIIPVPSFTEYEKAALRVNAKPIFVEMSEDFSMDIDKLKKCFSDNTRMLIVCNPHSPSGRLFCKEAMLELVEFCEGKSIYILVDENYMDFINSEQDYTLAPYVHKYGNLFVVRSFSKFFGMPGLRLGYGIASDALVRLLEDFRLPWNVSVLSIIAGQAALKDKSFIEKTKRYIASERRKLALMLSELNMLKVFPSEVNFLLVKILDKSITAASLKSKLSEKGIMIRSCEDFRGLDESYLRISVRKSEENMFLIKALNEILLGSKTEITA